jgi:membrane protease YdiL (CAAX protease family)
MQRTDSVRQAGEIRQHSIALSILLHLVPGLVSLGALFALSQPVFFRSLGMAPELGPLFGYTGANLLVLVPILLGWLVIEGRKRNGRLSLAGIICYTRRSPVWQYLALVPLFIAFNFAMFMVVAPLIQPTIVDAFFAWWPEQYNFQNAMQDLDRFSRYSGVQALAIAYALTLGILTPLVEELYFRGYLLPRMEGYAKKWAPLLNVALFSIYHFFSPWENPVRIVALLPQFYVVWRKRDIRFGIWTHVLINMIGGVMILVAVFAP